MKKIVKYLTVSFLALIAVGCMAACDDSQKNELPSLDTPKKILADFWELTWEGVDNATGYSIKISDQEYQTQETSFSLFEYFEPDEEYVFEIKALGDGAIYSDSEWKTVMYNAQGVTKGLEYTLLDDGTYQVACPAKSIPSNGELVLPDTYRNSPVTVFAPYSETGLNIVGMETKYTKVSKVRLSKNLTTIRQDALYCASIKKVDIPSSVKAVTGFRNCTKLTEVTLHEGLETLESSAFFGCSALTEIDFPNSLTSIGLSAFRESDLSEINWSENLTNIGRFAFQDTRISQMNIPDSVMEIGKDAFLNTPWYEDHADGLVYCGNFLYAYKGDMPENTVLNELPATLTGMTEEIFSNRTQLIGITLPDGIESIPARAFNGCANLQQVVLPKNLKAIDTSAFNGCTALTELTLPDTVTAVDLALFAKTGIAHINLPSSVTTLSGTLSADSDNITGITLPSSITSLDYNAFYQATNLTKFYYTGTAEQWAQMEINEEYKQPAFSLLPIDPTDAQAKMDAWKNALTVYYYSAEAPSGEGNYWHYGANGEIVVWE